MSNIQQIADVTGKVALVTGGSRGIGKGIAQELGLLGATVYVTGRTVAQAELGPGCVPLPCDHSNDDHVRAAIDRIIAEQQRIDILANSVWGGYEQMVENGQFTWGVPFWRQPLWRWDAMFTAGVRAYYVASVLVAKHMVEQHQGLIANVSAWSAQKHIGNVAYGVSKAATDKLTADMAFELREQGVAVVSVYPGMVRTEKVMAAAAYLDLSNSESPRFIGRTIAALAADPDAMQRSGSVVVAAAYARERGFRDIDGKEPRPLTINDV